MLRLATRLGRKRRSAQHDKHATAEHGVSNNVPYARYGDSRLRRGVQLMPTCCGDSNNTDDVSLITLTANWSRIGEHGAS